MGPLLSRFSRHPILLIFLIISLLLLLFSTFHSPDPTSSAMQFPSLLPSRYPPARIPTHPELTARIASLRSNHTAICSGDPVYSQPGLTPSQEKRYAQLRRPRKGRSGGQGKYMLVTTIRQIQSQLPDLLNTILILTTFLGPERVSFSFLEGPSDDCTSDVLENVLRPLLLSLGVPDSHIGLQTRAPHIDFNRHNRIEILAELRNRAFAPLWDEGNVGKDVVAVVAFNDVYLRAGDVLELLHQHLMAGKQSEVETGITTGMDYLERWPEWYYDIWVGRTIDTGDLFIPMPEPYWIPSEDLFPTSPSSLSHYRSLQPFPVYSSWNGLAVLSPTPFLPPHNVRFRRSDHAPGECAASECGLVAQDFWRVGFGRVQVVPSVQLGYTEKVAKQIRDELANTQSELGWVDGIPPPERDITVEWVKNPPDKIRCHPWPETNGLSANVWEKTRWVDPYTGIG